MEPADFLFPRDLEITPTGLAKVLLIGSCLSDSFVKAWRAERPEIEFEHILFNNAGDLPEKSAEDLAAYDFQYVQIPLRSVLTDAVVRFYQLNDDVFLSAIMENARNTIDAMLDAALAYNRQAQILTVVSNFPVPQVPVASSLKGRGSPHDLAAIVREMNVYLTERLRPLKDVFIADVDSVMASIGRRHVLDDSIYFYTHGSVFYPNWVELEANPHWTQPLPGRIEPVPTMESFYPGKVEAFFAAALRQAETIVRTVRQLDMVKVVIFDLDNTLWRGQLAEHYQSGQQWPYYDGWPTGVWEIVHQLKARGVLTAICSKNDENVVRQLWPNAIPEGLVEVDDFLPVKINWRTKAENVAEILEELSLTARSAVFVDDNPVERAAVQTAHPDIRTIGSNPFLTRRILLWSAETQVATLTAESANRDSMIRKQIAREGERKGLSREEFLANLNVEIELKTIRASTDAGYDRSLELLNKTNQFNTNGHRWSGAELTSFLAGGGVIYAFDVKDKFASYGLVGVVLYRAGVFEQFVMSCRVLGMEIEVAALAAIIARGQSDGVDVFDAWITETDANTVCRTVFTKAGFTEIETAHGLRQYRFEGAGHEPVDASHVAILEG